MSRDEIRDHAEHILDRMRAESHRIPTKVGPSVSFRDYALSHKTRLLHKAAAVGKQYQ